MCHRALPAHAAIDRGKRHQFAPRKAGEDGSAVKRETSEIAQHKRRRGPLVHPAALAIRRTERVDPIVVAAHQDQPVRHQWRGQNFARGLGLPSFFSIGIERQHFTFDRRNYHASRTGCGAGGQARAIGLDAPFLRPCSGIKGRKRAVSSGGKHSAIGNRGGKQEVAGGPNPGTPDRLQRKRALDRRQGCGLRSGIRGIPPVQGVEFLQA